MKNAHCGEDSYCQLAPRSPCLKLHLTSCAHSTLEAGGGGAGVSRYSLIPTFFQTIFNAFNMFQNLNPNKILFLSIQCHYKVGKGSLKKSMTLDIVLAVGIETS